ncbi:uncharacterized protein LOC143187564 isoform X2 [Calliopsis andreniformis]|uniref:uncharacterized protein LOC143187564 isoform X2 n=1 Tax=Calliopsis andreniformis TaxID=337506 RepID=UPI003FCD28D4
MVIPILHTRVIDICKISHIRENINILSTSKRRTQNAGFQCCVVIPCRIIYCELTLHGWTLDTLAGGWSYFVPAPTHGPRPGPAWTCLDLLELWPPLTLFNLHPSVFVYGELTVSTGCTICMEFDGHEYQRFRQKFRLCKNVLCL